MSLAAAIPLVRRAGYYRARFELVFEKLNACVFAGSSQFASEAFGAVGTVTSLKLEDSIRGKSTTISLLEQFYTINSDALTLDGQDIQDLDLSSDRRLFSLVAQEATLF